MPRKAKRTRYNPIHFCRIKGVPTEWKLSKFVEGIKSRIKSLVFVQRVADCRRNVVSDEVFIGMHDVLHYLALKEMQKITINEISCDIDFMEFFNGSAILPDDHFLLNVPTMMNIQPLKVVFKLTSVYVQGLLLELEKLGSVIGLSLNYCNRLKKSRSFGFVSFTPDSKLEALIDRTFVVDLLPVTLKPAFTIPVVVSEANRTLVDGPELIYVGDIVMANWLFTELEAEQVPAIEVPEGKMDESDKESVLSIENEIDLEQFL